MKKSYLLAIIVFGILIFASSTFAVRPDEAWSVCKGINITNDNTYEKGNESIVVNVTNIGIASSAEDELRIANADCDQGGKFINMTILQTDNQTFALVGFMTEAIHTAGTTLQYSVYYNTTSPARFPSSASIVHYDDFRRPAGSVNGQDPFYIAKGAKWGAAGPAENPNFYNNVALEIARGDSSGALDLSGMYEHGVTKLAALFRYVPSSTTLGAKTGFDNSAATNGLQCKDGIGHQGSVMKTLTAQIETNLVITPGNVFAQRYGVSVIYDSTDLSNESSWRMYNVTGPQYKKEHANSGTDYSGGTIAWCVQGINSGTNTHLWDLTIWNGSDTVTQYSDQSNITIGEEKKFLAFTVTILHPGAGDVFNVTSVDLNWTTDAPSISDCFFSVDGAANDSSICPGGIPTNITMTNLTEGPHNVTVYVDSGSAIESSTVPFTIDLTFPSITINPKNFHTNLNQSTIIQYENNVSVPINVTFLDERDLFGFTYNISFNGVEQFYEENLTLSGFNYTYVNTTDNTAWTKGIYDIDITVADSHTAKKIDEYEIDQLFSKMTFRTTEKNRIEIQGHGALDTDYVKKKDRYEFSFDYLLSSEERDITIKSDQKIFYKPESGYKAHFVIWNPGTKSGNWIDFEGIDGDYTVTKRSDYHYEIRFYNLKDEKSLAFRSIGGLNTRTSRFNWYKGSYTNTFPATEAAGEETTFVLNISRESGFVDDVNVRFVYNNTEQNVSKVNVSDHVRFTSAFNVPTVEATIDFGWQINITQGDDSEYTFDVNGTQDILLSFVNITFLEENNLTVEMYLQYL